VVIVSAKGVAWLELHNGTCGIGVDGDVMLFNL